MRRSVPALLITGTASTMVLAACGSASPTAQQAAPTATPGAVATSTVQPSSTGSGTVQGPSEDMQWGPVQVTIVVKGKAITDLTATAPTERARSALINQQAIPMLRQEVLQAKSVAEIKNIYGVSGATMTSEAFYQSLLAAVQQAHL